MTPKLKIKINSFWIINMLYVQFEFSILLNFVFFRKFSITLYLNKHLKIIQIVFYKIFQYNPKEVKKFYEFTFQIIRFLIQFLLSDKTNGVLGLCCTP